MDKKISAIMIAFTALCACAGGDAPLAEDQPFQWNTLTGEPPLIIAHRGASGYRPEHTLEAYKLAVEMGADVVEPDLVITKDGVLVARHDRYLSTTTNVADKPEFATRKKPNADPTGEPREDWWVEDFTLAELKTLRARQPFPGRSKEYDDQFEIPTFEEMLTLIAAEAEKAGRPVGVYPETKHPGYFEKIGLDFEAPLLAALEDFDAGPVFIQSFEPEILKRLKGKTGAKLVQLVYEETPGAGPNIPLEEIATYADGVGPSKYLLDLHAPQRGIIRGGFLDIAHQEGLFVHPWTYRDDQPVELPTWLLDTAYILDRTGKSWSFNEPEAPSTESQIVFISGADGIFADFPDTAYSSRDDLQNFK